MKSISRALRRLLWLADQPMNKGGKTVTGAAFGLLMGVITFMCL